MVKTQIERAHKLKIHSHPDRKRPHSSQIETFRFLAEHSPRWEELRIQLTSAISPLFPSLRNRLPSLHTLRIKLGGATTQTQIGSIDCFRTAPSLIDVNLFKIQGHVPVSLPAHQLTRYRLCGPWEIHRDILTLGHNLVEARLDVRLPQDWPNSSNTIHLSSLRRLYVPHTKVLLYVTVPGLGFLGEIETKQADTVKSEKRQITVTAT
ncbi:hypothetical protein DFH09DRAFT_1093429 [Mycena vulgaris]|nr:hypothetical protein DFH09DRAFT_1093429 [Mycena vulgaris]